MLAIDKVEAGYGNIQILNGVTLGVAKGQIVALLGGNGTGKSTLLNLLSGLDTPDAGEVSWGGTAPAPAVAAASALTREMASATVTIEMFPTLCCVFPSMSSCAVHWNFCCGPSTVSGAPPS